jgi:hypothetical protein
VINVSLGGTSVFEFHPSTFTSSKAIAFSAANAPYINNTSPTLTNPNLMPNKNDNTGLGYAASGHMVAVSNGLPAAGWVRLVGVVGTPVTIISNATGDVAVGISGTFVISDGAGGSNGGVITLTAPSANFDLFTDGGTNVCQLQVAADGSVTVQRTAGTRTYAVSLNLVWL